MNTNECRRYYQCCCCYTPKNTSVHLLVYGIWVYGIWVYGRCMVYGVWYMGVWYMVHGTCIRIIVIHRITCDGVEL